MAWILTPLGGAPQSLGRHRVLLGKQSRVLWRWGKGRATVLCSRRILAATLRCFCLQAIGFKKVVGGYGNTIASVMLRYGKRPYIKPGVRSQQPLYYYNYICEYFTK